MWLSYKQVVQMAIVADTHYTNNPVFVYSNVVAITASDVFGNSSRCHRVQEMIPAFIRKIGNDELLCQNRNHSADRARIIYFCFSDQGFDYSRAIKSAIASRSESAGLSQLFRNIHPIAEIFFILLIKRNFFLLSLNYSLSILTIGIPGQKFGETILYWPIIVI